MKKIILLFTIITSVFGNAQTYSFDYNLTIKTESIKPKQNIYYFMIAVNSESIAQSIIYGDSNSNGLLYLKDFENNIDFNLQLKIDKVTNAKKNILHQRKI